MAPPSGASNPPRGSTKKPVVPAIPYNLQQRQALHQRQQAQQQQIQHPTLQKEGQIVKPTDSNNNQPGPPASAASSLAPAASTPAASKLSLPSTIVDRTTTSSSGHANHSKSTTAGQTPVDGASTAGKSTGNHASHGAAAPSNKKNNRHHGPKPNPRGPTTTHSQAKAGGPQDGKPRKTGQQPNSKASKPQDQRPKVSTSNIETVGAFAESSIDISQSNGVHNPSSEHKDNTSNLNTPTSTSTASTSASRLEKERLALASPTSTPTTEDTHQTTKATQAVEGCVTANTNGINGTGRAEPVHFPSHQQILPGSLATMHHPHPSNGSLVFGGFRNSNASSPAPPTSGGYMPPHGTFPEPPPVSGRGDVNGTAHRRMDSGPGFSGPPPMMAPHAPDFVPTTTVDNYGRPLAFAPFDTFSPIADHYGPQTPLSFQGSASPLFPDRENGHMEVGAHQLRGASPNPFPPHPGHFAPPMMNPQMQNIDTGDNLLEYVKDQFNDSGSADCTLEFRPANAREHPPVHVDGHRLIFARSPVLKNLLQRAITEQSGVKPHIVLETSDPNIQPMAFYATLQRLYGHSLLSNPHPVNGMDMAGTFTDRLQYALSYAAAGHLLGIHPVVFRGLEIASQLISWDTIEVALSFALAGAPIPDLFPGANRELQAGSQFKYGNPTQILISGITDFLIHNWPRNFSLDTSVAKVAGYERLPYVDFPPTRKTPMIARGTRPRTMNPGLSSIQFGDVNNPAFGGATKTTPSPESSILSRILLNMPFGVLKFTMESMAHHSPEDRENAFAEVVAEREARRSLSIKGVYAGGFSSSALMRSWLDQGGSLEFGSPAWSTFGWKEYVVRHNETGLPCFMRRWFNEPGPRSPSSMV